MKGNRQIYYLFFLPVLVYIVVFYVLPIANITVKSILSEDGRFTLTNYGRIISQPVYLKVAYNTIKIAAIVAVSCLFIGYPVAYFLSRSQASVKRILIFIVLTPFFVITVVRTFAWMVILGLNGPANALLAALGVIREPLRLLSTFFSVWIGLTHLFLPIMILILQNSIEQINPRIIQAAHSLGAMPRFVFLKVYLPLTIPGIVAGTIIVFLLATGVYITPSLLGGGKEIMMAMVIEEQVNSLLNPAFGSALAVSFAVIVLGSFFLVNSFVDVTKFLQGK